MAEIPPWFSPLRLGAVSSLLLVCYDAVLEVDDTLCLTAESPQLSSLLLRSQRRWCGKSFLECCFEWQTLDAAVWRWKS